MKKIIILFCIGMSSVMGFSQSSGIDLSIEFFKAVRTKSAEKDNLRKQMADLSPQVLEKELDTDLKTLAFWINVYNANIQYLLNQNPALYNDRGAFFKAEQITIAGKVMSFDLIEHGILRRSKTKWSLGYFGKINVPPFEKQFRIKRVDPRIHYALNCGANSCPSIYPYTFENVDKELDMSCKSYLEQNVRVKDGKLLAPVLFSWFRADFGGVRGVRNFILKYQVVTKEESKLPISFSDYDWTIDEDPYRNN